MAKPASLPLWATTGTVTEPSMGYKQAGFVVGNNFIGPYVNWLLNLVYQWCAYLDGLEAEALTWTAAHEFHDDVQFTNGTDFVFWDSTAGSFVAQNGAAYVRMNSTGNEGDLEASRNVIAANDVFAGGTTTPYVQLDGSEGDVVCVSGGLTMIQLDGSAGDVIAQGDVYAGGTTGNYVKLDGSAGDVLASGGYKYTSANTFSVMLPLSQMRPADGHAWTFEVDYWQVTSQNQQLVGHYQLPAGATLTQVKLGMEHTSGTSGNATDFQVYVDTHDVAGTGASSPSQLGTTATRTANGRGTMTASGSESLTSATTVSLHIYSGDATATKVHWAQATFTTTVLSPG